MATITLYKDKVNGVGSLLDDIIKSSNNLNVQLGTIKNTLQGVNSSTCNLQDAVDSISSSSKSESDKVEDLKKLNGKLTDFIELTTQRDASATSEIERAKEDFYTKYSYLKPDCEKSVWEHICDSLSSAVDWCKDHWKEIAITVAIVVGAVLAIAAVIASGGMALVPILTSALTAFGVSAGTAMTVATVASLTVATVAVVSTVGSSTLNIIDTWCKIDNPTFNGWQNALNITSGISNGLYSIGGIYNGIKGVSNANLRNYSKQWISNPEFRSAVSGASKYNFTLKPNTSTFWSGIGDKGMNNGDQVAANCAEKMGRTTMENTLNSHGIEMPKWDPSNPSTINAWTSSSSSYAMHSSGDVSVLLSDSVRSNSVWNVFEKTILGVNPNITSITTYTPTMVSVVTNTTQVGSIISGLSVGTAQTGTLLNDWN